MDCTENVMNFVSKYYVERHFNCSEPQQKIDIFPVGSYAFQCEACIGKHRPSARWASTVLLVYHQLDLSFQGLIHRLP